MTLPKRRWLSILLVAAVLAAAAGVVILVRGDDDTGTDSAVGTVDPSDVLTSEQLDLLDSAVPDSGCPDEPVAAPDDASLVALDVLLVDGTCLVGSTEYVSPDEVDRRQTELEDEPGVVAAGVVRPVSLHEDDDRRDDQWPLDLLGADEDSSELPWPDGSGAVLAVVDTGVDASHPDLAGAVVDRRHYPGEGGLDEHGHGTHVAGIAAARRDNGGIVGVAPGVDILDVPVKLVGANENGQSWPIGLAWAVNHGADVANMSIGGVIPETLTPEDLDELSVEAAAVYFATRNDVVVIASGGNCGPEPSSDCVRENQRESPASLDGVTAVGAVQDDFDLAGYSTRNDDIDLVAPGGGDVLNQVLSTVPGGDYDEKAGTSQAAPHVAAAAAILRAAVPDATVDDVVGALLDSADLDRLDEGDREGPGVGRGLLDIPGALEQVGASAEPPDDAGDRTQAAFVQDDTLFAFDGGSVQRVRSLDPGVAVRWVAWSEDRSRLVGADDGELFSWAGAGTESVEMPCDWCSDALPAYVEDVPVGGEPVEGGPERPEETGDFVVGMDVDGMLTWYDAATLDEVTTTMPTFPPDSVGSKTLLGTVAGQLLVHESGGAQASERLWLLDPASGTAEVSHDVMGSAQAPIAVAAGGAQVAVVTGYGACGAEVVVLDGADLTEVAATTVPDGLIVDEAFFNGETLYATMATAASDCSALTPDGLWRLNGGQWQQVDPLPLAARPLEGRADDVSPTGWLAVRSQGDAVVDPPAPEDTTGGELGQVTDGPWSTPTETEVEWTPLE